MQIVLQSLTPAIDLAERLAKRFALPVPLAREWAAKLLGYAALAPEERRTHYTMDELVLIFNTAPGRIGTALHALGWQRRRSWREGASYARFWMPSLIHR